MFNGKIYAAVRTDYDFEKALKSDTDTIFLIHSNVLTLNREVKKAHEHSKKLFVHFDLAEGIGKDKAGILLVKGIGADGILSTRVNIIKAAKESDMFCVQRFFIVDSQSIDTTIESYKSAKPDMIEIMPGIAPKVISQLKQKISVPIIAGGLIETKEEIASALFGGATAVSTGKSIFW